jgi:hypothetical protein
MRTTVIGMVLVNARFLLERDGAVTVTVPPDRVAAAQIEPALVRPERRDGPRAPGHSAAVDPWQPHRV